MTAGMRHRLGLLLEPWFIFSLVWSIGATTDDDGRVKFSKYLRSRMEQMGTGLPFPEEGDVFDYCLEDDTLGSNNEDEEEEAEEWKPKWVSIFLLRNSYVMNNLGQLAH